jgi:hypothetical protein
MWPGAEFDSARKAGTSAGQIAMQPVARIEIDRKKILDDLRFDMTLIYK